MFVQIFLSPQVKQSEVINNKHGVYKLPHKLPIDLRLRMLWNQRIPENLKTSKKYSLVLSLPPKMKVFSILARNYWQI